MGSNIFQIDSSKITTYHFNKIDEQTLIDTSINNLHLFHPAQTEQQPFYFDLGNLGQPVYQFYHWQNVPFGFNPSIASLEPMHFTFDNQPLYSTYTKAFSDLKYVVGFKNENLLDAIHSQNINQNFHFDAHYRYINSDGIYLRQTTKHQNLFLNLSFVSNSERYHAQVSYLVNQFRWQQNGGTINDSIYENNYINKNVVPVVFQNAYSRMKEDAWQIANSYEFGSHYAKKINDTATIKHFIPFFRIQHVLKISNQYRHNADDNFDSLNYLPLHYSSPTIDSFGNKDSLVNSLVIHTYSNQINWLTMPYKKFYGDSVLVARKTLINLGIEHQLIQAKFAQLNKSDYNFNLHGKIKSNDLNRKKFNYNIAADYCVSGYNKGDYKLSLFAFEKIMNSNFVGIDAFAQQYRNALNILFWSNESLQQQYFSDSHQTTIQSATIFWKNNRFNFKLSFTNNLLTNYQYFNNNAQLIAGSRTITQPYFQLKKDFIFYHWHFNNLFNYNIVQNSEIPMPAVLYRGQLYYENKLFKKVLLLQIGMQLNYQDKYFAPQWMPVFDYFYNQQINFGSQQNLQFFVNAKIKQARIFVKIDNLLQGVDGHGYYIGKYYPLPDRGIKFGISWRFFDE